ncbi:thiopurine S-methyltransferase (TPMT) [Thioploca ingrica]|uniref:Thiopurine S-methyltransferase (TPMT) n=1 Tax=Thioploca ingrica TaxID=40754 RepID=A0A090BUQ8_9GAMM|nr:thiopurine S-methyltransferase (TPMT) [Thioploca ingrica]
MTTEKRELPDWETLYQTEPVEKMPWFYEALDHDFANTLKQLNITQGRLLDLGTGPGTQAMVLAQMGFTVTATDISSAAIAKAKHHSLEQHHQIDFIQDDILNSQLQQTFQVILDRGCFHVMHSEQRESYLKTTYRLLEPNGYLLLKCFSHLETMAEGPYRFTPAEITTFFSPLFKIHSITASVFQGTREPPPQALFSIMEKK